MSLQSKEMDEKQRSLKDKKVPSPLKLVSQDSSPQPATSGTSGASNPPKITSHDDLIMRLEKCSLQSPLMEGYGCKDVSKARALEPFRRRYFVLYNGLLLYYHHKSHFEKDKKNGLVS